MKRLFWPLLTVLLLGFCAYQFDTIRQLRMANGLYNAKVANAFRYTGLHMDLTTLPAALDELAAHPDPDRLARAEAAAQAYTDLLYQINDLRESGSPNGQGSLMASPYTYHPATQSQVDVQGQILKAGLWPSVQVIGVLLRQHSWQLRSEDELFLKDAAALVRRLNDRLGVVEEALKREHLQPGIFPLAQQNAGQIGPVLDELAKREQAHRAMVPAQP